MMKKKKTSEDLSRAQPQKQPVGETKGVCDCQVIQFETPKRLRFVPSILLRHPRPIKKFSHHLLSNYFFFTIRPSKKNLFVSPFFTIISVRANKINQPWLVHILFFGLALFAFFCLGGGISRLVQQTEKKALSFYTCSITTLSSPHGGCSPFFLNFKLQRWSEIHFFTIFIRYPMTINGEHLTPSSNYFVGLV
jgi:hypothetical protein